MEGAAPIKCPSCDATIGETHEMTETERKQEESGDDKKVV
jgi:DNA-directed RNA polymerase subunit N (RpoN/RPB10)